jgi:hypothetical protein
MNKTHLGLADDARPFIGDAFYYPEFTSLEPIDLGADLGAAPASIERRREARNTLIIHILLAAWHNPKRWTAYSRDRNYYKLFNYYFCASTSYKDMMWAVETLEAASLILHRKARPSPLAHYRSTLRATPNLVRRSPINSVKRLRRISCAPIRLKN